MKSTPITTASPAPAPVTPSVQTTTATDSSLGCPAGAVYNFMTGGLCGSTNSTLGCPAGAIYNFQTGQKCSTTSTQPTVGQPFQPVFQPSIIILLPNAGYNFKVGDATHVWWQTNQPILYPWANVTLFDYSGNYIAGWLNRRYSSASSVLVDFSHSSLRNATLPADYQIKVELCPTTIVDGDIGCGVNGISNTRNIKISPATTTQSIKVDFISSSAKTDGASQGSLTGNDSGIYDITFDVTAISHDSNDIYLDGDVYKGQFLGLEYGDGLHWGTTTNSTLRFDSVNVNYALLQSHVSISGDVLNPNDIRFRIPAGETRRFTFKSSLGPVESDVQAGVQINELKWATTTRDIMNNSYNTSALNFKTQTIALNVSERTIIQPSIGIWNTWVSGGRTVNILWNAIGMPQEGLLEVALIDKTTGSIYESLLDNYTVNKCLTGGLYEIPCVSIRQGSISLPVPATLPTGEYKVRINCVVRSAPNLVKTPCTGDFMHSRDDSDNYFTITQTQTKPTLTLERQTINSGDVATLNFTPASNTTAAWMYLVCPAGLTGVSEKGITNVCNKWTVLGTTAFSYGIQFTNSTKTELKAVPNYYVMTPAKPGLYQAVSGEITVKPVGVVSAQPSIKVDFVSSSAKTDGASSGSITGNDTGIYTITFDVTAIGDDVFIDGDVPRARFGGDGINWATTTNTTYGFDYLNYLPLYILEAEGEEGSNSVAPDVKTSGAISYGIPEGETRRFTLQVNIGPAPKDVQAGIILNGLRWDTDSGDTHDNLYNFNLGRFRTDTIFLNQQD
ncbi:MAG: hypothetical protein A3B09_02145 [Candidatus Taylorbacteria bacterium RIFCSPLOWO2_01_FULL_43_83]|nr:MAG: hypothetical protein A3B09_02145 [Candidatus Taylorbacteria bacterium RIFCSPLOWO2_01_FULL_43_83]